MKNIICLTVLLLSLLCSAQKETVIELDWQDAPLVFSENINVDVPYFQPEYFGYELGSDEVFFHYSMPASVENDFVISNIVYQTISKEQLGRLSWDKLPKDINKNVNKTKSRDKNYLTLEFSPIIKDGNALKRVKSFTLRAVNNGIASKSMGTNAVPSISNSVLASGEWFKFYVEKSGVYKLSRSFLQSLGMNLNGADPRKIKIYGNGGRMLPLMNNEDYPFDPVENAIQIVGEEDGQFDSQDYILFYAEGTDVYNQESDTHINLYSDRSYYYITTSGFENGKRITTMVEPLQTPVIVVNEFDDYQFYERDLTNFARLGRKWVGESFNIQSEQTFTFTFPNLVSSVPVQFNGVTAINSAGLAASFMFKANGNEIGTSTHNSVSNPSGETYGRLRTLNTTFNENSDNIDITVSFNNNGVPTLTGYLDYIAITARRQLRGINKQFQFFYNDAQNNIGVIEYQISFANTITEIWDVTDIYNVTKKQNSGNTNFSFKANMGEKRKYVALEPNDFYTPLRERQSMRVVNQNLKGTVFKDNNGNYTDVDYLIITPAFLNAQAEKLANFHRNNSGLVVKVVNLENIYPEFSSGKQDIGAIRNFVRYVYHNASAPDKKLKFVNLFGDASFDFKNRTQGNTNIVPIFHRYSSSTFSQGDFCSDDYFGMMDENEGNMGGNDRADVAVGRMLVSNANQAEQMVQKVIDYHDQKSYGRWRNNITLISDDIDKSADESMQFKLNELADAIQANKPFFNVNKIFIDAYVQETASGGARYPQARKDIISAFENGSLVFNYLGHGGEEGLAHERILEKSDGQNLNNRYKYPVFVTVTCEFTKFDNPLHPTAGEYVYWNPSGGAVNMITTTRTIGIGTAENFNLRLGQVMFSYQNYENLPYPTVGEALRVAKNDYGNMGATRMVACIGDPALQLAIPKPKVILTHVNDTLVSEFTGSLEALSYVKIKGYVADGNDNLLPNYNGELAIQVFDKKISRTTLGNDGYVKNGQLYTMDFDILGETIFRGNATVAGGLFEFGFVVPKDIKIPIDYGRISFYAKRLSPLEDQTGFSEEIKVGGLNEDAPVDNTPPTVKLYMNDTSFISGGITNASPIFLAYLEDENGMNTAGGIGHDMVAILDGDEMNPYILNDYYQTELDDYTNGKVSYPFRNLEPGLHTITFKAWDVYNNMITAEIQFVVVGDETIQLENVLNYPNPFVSYTEFWFSHNRPFEPLDVQVQVLTITGKVVWTKNQTITTEGFLSRDITWDGRDDFGDKIGKGVYIYKLTVKSSLTGKKAEKYEKLVVL
ncbi:MAG: type IX secretion system sortase PorU [Flavobacteriaceae bacterium]